MIRSSGCVTAQLDYGDLRESPFCGMRGDQSQMEVACESGKGGESYSWRTEFYFFFFKDEEIGTHLNANEALLEISYPLSVIWVEPSFTQLKGQGLLSDTNENEEMLEL